MKHSTKRSIKKITRKRKPKTYTKKKSKNSLIYNRKTLKYIGGTNNEAGVFTLQGTTIIKPCLIIHDNDPSKIVNWCNLNNAYISYKYLKKKYDEAFNGNQYFNLKITSLLKYFGTNITTTIINTASNFVLPTNKQDEVYLVRDECNKAYTSCIDEELIELRINNITDNIKIVSVFTLLIVYIIQHPEQIIVDNLIPTYLSAFNSFINTISETTTIFDKGTTMCSLANTVYLKVDYCHVINYILQFMKDNNLYGVFKKDKLQIYNRIFFNLLNRIINSDTANAANRFVFVIKGQDYIAMFKKYIDLDKLFKNSDLAQVTLHPSVNTDETTDITLSQLLDTTCLNEST